MSVKLRLSRKGRRKRPIWAIVAADSRKPRDGRYIEDLGRYFPLEQPARVNLKEERVLYWLAQGARPSDTVRSMLSKQGLMLVHHLQKQGKSDAEIAEAVEQHRSARADKGTDVKITAEDRRQAALKAERERVEELEAEEARKRKEAEEKKRAEAERKKAEAAAAEAEQETAAGEAEDEGEAAVEEQPEAAAEPAAQASDEAAGAPAAEAHHGAAATDEAEEDEK